MSSQCKVCLTYCTSRGKISCGLCKQHYHPKCAIQENSNLNSEMLELLKKTESGLLFLCKACSSMPLSSSTQSSNKEANPDTTKLLELENGIKSITQMVSNVMSQLNLIKSDLDKSLSKSKETEELFHSKIHSLEIENNSLRRQLNRGDIVVNGLSKALTRDKLYAQIFKIGEVLGVNLQHNDINVCTYIQGKAQVLVKFNSIYKRDQLIQKYFEKKSLYLNELYINDEQPLNSEGSENEQNSTGDQMNTNDLSEIRVYLNEHLTPIAAKLNYMCRRMLKTKKIKKFKLYNRDVPEVKITLNDGGEKTFNIEKLHVLFKAVSSQNGQQQDGTNHTE
ncbi:hypothetical protein FF38_02086 [Lucilia cuprina]|uniref:Zinc finger PHD-type domain-containing protein n=1 Tax=Lucilia cuprina TaxID=7375 RepID=A0A0L0CMH1_LUCCU|nr:hypothetical protein FF38_02086 [Lucilia cuprina]